jgi:hypothetical protein
VSFPGFIHPMMGRNNSARRIGFNAYANAAGSQAITWPTGTQAGDLAVIYVCYSGGSSGVSGLTGWTRATSAWGLGGYTDNFYSRVLTAGDVSSPPTIIANPGPGAGGPIIVHVYRGPTRAAVRAAGTDTVTGHSSISAGGFGQAGSHMGAVAFEGDRDPAGTASCTAPPNSTACITNQAGSFFSTSSADWLGPSYSGAAVTFSGSATTTGRNLTVIELAS